MDLLFLLLDRQETPANVGTLFLFEPPAQLPARTAIRRIVRAYRAARPIAPFNQIADFTPLGLPHWRETDQVDMKYHVRQEVLPAPGSLPQLRERAAELHREPLDRSRPLFEVHLIDGLEHGRFALYFKSHHALWDGRSALPRVFGSMSAEPGPILAPFYAGEPGVTAADSSALTGSELASGLRGALGQVMALRELFAKFSSRIGVDGQQPRIKGRGNAPFSGPHTLFNEPVVQQRSFAMFGLPLDEMRRVGRAFGGTLNDVVLAVVDDGLQRYLRARGENHRDPLVAMCPVSLREPGDLEATTKVATMFVPMATPRTSATRRMHEIIENTGAAKSELKSLSNEAAVDYAALVFGLWLGARLLGVHNIARPVINFVISNVGGIEGPRYLGESRLLGAYPISMLAEPTGLNITALSTDGRMDFGIVANLAAVPDAEDIANACRAAFSQLRNAARRRPSPAIRTSPSGKTPRAATRAPAASR